MNAISNRTMKKYESMIEKKLLTKSEINTFGRLLNSKRFSKEERRNQINTIISELKDTYKITDEQTRQGIDWLRKNILNERTGTLRKSKLAAEFSNRDIEIIKNFSYFEFVGFEEHSNGYSSHYTPVYRTVAKNGDYFDYTAIHWGPCMVLATGTYPSKLELVLA